MRNLFLSFVTVLFLVPLSRAGVSSVGNGGGLAELEFIFYFNNSDKIVNYCLAAENSCHLTLEQSRVWKQLQRTVKKFQSSYTVDLISESSRPWFVEGTILTLNQNLLYAADGTPINESSNLALSIAIQLSVANPELDFPQTLAETKINLNGFYFEKQTSTAPVSNGIYFHQMTVKSAKPGLMLFVMEDEKQSVSLNDMIQTQLPGIDMSSLELYQVEGGARMEKVIFYGLAKGISSAVKFNNKHFRLEATFKPGTFEIDPNRVRFQLSIE